METLATSGVMMIAQPNSRRQTNPLTTQAALRQAIHDEVLEEIADCLGAELTNIFTVISGMLQLRIMVAGEAAECCWTRSALETAKRGAQLANGLITCVGPQVGHPQLIELDSFLTKQSIIFAAVNGALARAATYRSESIWQVFACPTALVSLLHNLAENARSTMRDGGSLQIDLSNINAAKTVEAARDFVLLRISFPRSPLTDADIVSALKPEFLKRRRHAAALNLHDGYAIIRRGGGDVSVENVQDGVCVNIWLSRAKWLSPEWFTQPGQQPPIDTL
jgi:hypothetical protein